VIAAVLERRMIIRFKPVVFAAAVLMAAAPSASLAQDKSITVFAAA
jgi:hypothetical protein